MAVNTKLVIDASAVLARLLPDEKTPREIKNIFRQYQSEKLVLVAPNLLPYEVGNALRSLTLSHRIPTDLAPALFEDFLNLRISYVEIDFNRVLSLAISAKISVYDASYLFLARKLNANLLTLDKRLLKLQQA